MKKTLFLSIIFFLMAGFAINVNAQTSGEQIFNDLAGNKLSCGNLTEQQFEDLGEFYMGRMTGISHADMDSFMEQMMGGDFVNQMHIAMGKRLSGCYPDYEVGGNFNFVPMMGMMMNFSQGGWSSPDNIFSNMMNPTMMGGNFGFGFSPFGWLGGIVMVLWWVLIIVLVVVFIRWIVRQGQGQGQGWKREEKSPVEILKERYAKGEIDKIKYEEMKKELEK